MHPMLPYSILLCTIFHVMIRSHTVTSLLRPRWGWYCKFRIIVTGRISQLMAFGLCNVDLSSMLFHSILCCMWANGMIFWIIFLLGLLSFASEVFSLIFPSMLVLSAWIQMEACFLWLLFCCASIVFWVQHKFKFIKYIHGRCALAYLWVMGNIVFVIFS